MCIIRTGKAVFADGAIVTNLTAVDGGVVDLYAAWQRRMHTVEFYSNKKLAQLIESRVVGEGLQIGELPAAPGAETGYSFAGWRDATHGLSKTVVAADTVVMSDMAVCAIYTANTYTVTFDANGGAGGTSAKLAYGTEITAPTVTREGYTFTGWTPAVAATVPASDVKYVAQWRVNQYKVTFDADTNTFTLKPAHTHDFTYTGSGDAAFTNLLTKSGNGTVSCASGNTDVETVNSESGEVTIVGVDEATARPFTSRSLRQTIQITPALRP